MGHTEDSFPAASLRAEKQLLDKSSAAHFRASPEDWCLKASSTDCVLKTCTAAEFHQLTAGRCNYSSQQSLRQPSDAGNTRRFSSSGWVFAVLSNQEESGDEMDFPRITHKHLPHDMSGKQANTKLLRVNADFHRCIISMMRGNVSDVRHTHL